MKQSQALLETLLKTDSRNPAIPVIKLLAETSEAQYKDLKQVEKEPSMVYQLYGKKTAELTPDEGRAYRALLKRQRDAKKRELRNV